MKKFVLVLLVCLFATSAFASTTRELIRNAIATSAQFYAFSDEGVTCGGDVLSFKILEQNSHLTKVEAIITADVNYCRALEKMSCTGTYTYNKKTKIYDEVEFNCFAIGIEE